ncbi:MAG TPA: AgmX/PglI C-terminal domain-containing protein, partial [Polyangiaceae bacterium]|nr:AgmX/PglI C-terminal domain-containing protein [Polyangiaceae bacterium]
MWKRVSFNRTASSAVLSWLCALGVTACGGGDEKRPKHADEAVIEETPEQSGSGPSMSSEIGGLNQEAVDKVFSSVSSELTRCLGDGAERVEFLGGDVEFLVKIGSDGRVSHAHLEASTLGDRATEVCMIDALKRRSWPKPVGGDLGIAQKPFSFDMAKDVRPPTEWSADSIEEALGELAPKIDDCKAGGGSFSITMYVDTDG